jgi:hypothetical protein
VVTVDTWLGTAPLKMNPPGGVFYFMRRLRYAVADVVATPRCSFGTTLRAAWPV